MRTSLYVWLLILVFPLHAQNFENEEEPLKTLSLAAERSYEEDFTLDDWLYLYKDGFFGEVEDVKLEEESDLFEDEILLAINEILLLEEIGSAEDNVLLEENNYYDENDIEEETIITEDNDYNLFFEGSSLILEVPAFSMRSFDDIFPSFTPRQKRSAMWYGLNFYFKKDESPNIIPNPDLGIDLLSAALSRNPSHLIEVLLVVPYINREIDLLDIYNALGRINKINEYSAAVFGEDYYVFTESSRIENNRRRRDIPDPPDAITLPFSETIYLRLKENSLGNIFLRGEISVSLYGITYNMTNFLDVRYFLVPVMRAERFSAIIYLEPIKEGVLIYCISGFYLPNFVADRVNLTPNINRRINIFVKWITDGLKEMENQAEGSR